MWVRDDFETYLSTDAISASGLVTLYTHTPAHYKFRDSKATKQTSWGTTIHEFVQDDLSFQNNYAVWYGDQDKRSREYKAFKLLADAQKQKICTGDEYGALLKIKENVSKNERASEILKPGVEYEVSGYHDGRRIRPDCKIGNTIFDIKTTTRGIEKEDFTRHVFGAYYYCVQAAFYVDTASLIDGKKYDFVWVVIEQEAPYSVKTFKASEETLAIGRQIYTQSLEIYLACKQANEWPSYHDANETIEPPEWFTLKGY